MPVLGPGVDFFVSLSTTSFVSGLAGLADASTPFSGEAGVEVAGVASTVSTVAANDERPFVVLRIVAGLSANGSRRAEGRRSVMVSEGLPPLSDRLFAVEESDRLLADMAYEGR